VQPFLSSVFSAAAARWRRCRRRLLALEVAAASDGTPQASHDAVVAATQVAAVLKGNAAAEHATTPRQLALPAHLLQIVVVALLKMNPVGQPQQADQNR